MISHFSHVQVFGNLKTVAHQYSPGKNTGMGCHTLLQGIFLTQGSNSSLISPTLVGRLFTPGATWEAHLCILFYMQQFVPLNPLPLHCKSMKWFTNLCVILVQGQCESSLYTVPILLQVLPDQAQKYSLRENLGQVMVDRQLSMNVSCFCTWDLDPVWILEQRHGSQFRDVLIGKKIRLWKTQTFDQPSALASGEVRGREACAASSPENAVGGTDLSSPENRFHSRAK